MRSRRSRVAVPAVLAVLVLGAALVGVPVTPAGGAPDPADVTAAARAAAWITTQQQPDGGFEVSGFTGFETPDAVLAIAGAAQTGTTWSTSTARAAIEGLHAGGPSGPTPIDALDAWASGGVNAGEASKIVVLVAAPLGIDPAHFGPSDVDLATVMYPSGCSAAPASSGLFFYESMFLALGGAVLCGSPAPAILTAIRAAQRTGGGWNYNGSLAPANPDDPFDPNSPDVDSTAVAIEALVAGGAAWNDPAILSGLTYLASQRSENGAFRAFGADDPNATAVAMLAIAAAGFDPDRSCWRDTVLPASAGAPYTPPDAWLRAQQQANGRIASPNDGATPNTFASSQSAEALLRTWLPIERAAGAPTCAPITPAVVAEPVVLAPRLTG
ncbi:MAG: hypothetical protein ACKOA9_02245 [Actinomycetota bacterium]